jgi:hypothetical protein
VSNAQTASTSSKITSLQKKKTPRSWAKKKVASKDQVLEFAKHTAHKDHEFLENEEDEQLQANETLEQATEDAAHDEAQKASENTAAHSQKFLEHSDVGQYAQDEQAVENGNAEQGAVEPGSQGSAEVQATAQHTQGVADLVTAEQNTPGAAEDAPTEQHVQNREGGEYDSRKSASIAGLVQYTQDVAAHDEAEQNTQKAAENDADDDVVLDDDSEAITERDFRGPYQSQLAEFVARDGPEGMAAEKCGQAQEDAEWNVMEQEFKKVVNCSDATREQEVLEAKKPLVAEPHKINKADSEDLQLRQARELAELEKNGFVEVAESSITKAQQQRKKRKSPELFPNEGSSFKRPREGLSIAEHQQFTTPFQAPGIPTGRIDRIGKFGIKRNLNYLPGRASAILKPDGRTRNSTSIEAHLVQERGEISRSPCDACASKTCSTGTWKECVVLDGFSEGSCANCHLEGRGAYCSLSCKFNQLLPLDFY